MRWTRKSIIEEIRRMKSAGGELSYSSVERDHLNLTRAAAWHFGNWRGAIEAAGIEYDDIRKYRRWNRERVVARIRELHKEGADLSWRAVSTRVDPPLAAAALRVEDFSSWRDAIEAAGLNSDDVARYRYWNEARVIAALQDARKSGDSLSSKAAQQRDQPLFCAARRRFGSWDNALQKAGIASQRKSAAGRPKDAASTRASQNAAPKKTETSAPNATNKRGAKSAPVKAAPKTAASAPTKNAAPKKAAAPSAASTRGEKRKTESNASAAKSALERNALKSSASKIASGAKASAETSVAKSPASKPPAAKSASAKSVKTTTSRAAKK